MIYTYKELTQEYLKVRKEKDTLKIKVLGLLIDKIQKSAKNNKSEDYDIFLDISLKSEIKQCQQAVDNKVQGSIQEMQVLQSLLSPSIDTDELVKIILDIKANNESATIGDIAKILKTIEGVDMSVAMVIIKGLTQ